MRRILAWCREWQPLVVVAACLWGFISDFVGPVREKELWMPLLLQLPETLTPWLSAVVAGIGSWLLCVEIWPKFKMLVRRVFWPAVVGSKPRRFYSLLPEVKSCLDVLEKDYEFEAATLGRSDGVTAPPFDSHVRYAELRSQLGRLFSKLEKLGIPVPDSIQIDSLGDLIDMIKYLTQLKNYMSVCDLAAAREIVPP